MLEQVVDAVMLMVDKLLMFNLRANLSLIAAAQLLMLLKVLLFKVMIPIQRIKIG
jgi:hypothetical protein